MEPNVDPIELSITCNAQPFLFLLHFKRQFFGSYQNKKSEFSNMSNWHIWGKNGIT